MANIDLRALRSSIFVGALVGAIIGFGLSGTLRASSGDAEPVATPTCRSLCENVLWLRAPVLHRVR